MPVFEVTSPDGKTYEVTAPDGATQDQVLAYAKTQFSMPATTAAPSAPVEPMSRLYKVAKGAMDPIDAAAQLLERAMPQKVSDLNTQFNNWIAEKTGLLSKLPERNVSSLVTGQKTGIDALIEANEKAYQAKRKAAGESGFDAYRTVGNVVSPANLVVASKLPAAASLIGKVGAGVLGGGLSGALNPVTEGDFASEKAKQIGIGSLFGAAVPAVAAGVGRIISPKASTNTANELLKSEGVQQTIGQTLGGKAGRIEESLQSLPIVGDAIASARQGARNQLNTAAINRSLKEVDLPPVKGFGQEAVKEAGDRISQFYEKGKAMLGNFKIDQVGDAEIKSLSQMAKQLPKKEQAVFNQAIETVKGQITPQGHLLADGYKTLTSKLTNDSAKFSGSTDAYQQKLGDALKELESIITENAKRANPIAGKMLNDADRAWANLVPVELAAKAAKNTQGVFSPAQLNAGIQGADKSVRDRATARGTAIMQDLSNAGQLMLGNKVPDSGTAGRLGWGALGASLMTNPVATAGGVLGGVAAYSPLAQKVLRGAVSSRPESAQAVAGALQKASPYLIPAGAQIGLGLNEN